MTLSFKSFLFFAFIAAAIMAPITTDATIPNLADFINHLAAIIQGKLALTEGQFPLRVMPLEQSGMRYPLYQFSSSTSYTLAGAIYRWLTPSNPLIAFRLVVWGALVIGGIYMSRLAYWLVKSRPAAILAGVVYLCSPYYIIIIDQLGSFNEIIALGILPAVLYSTFQRYYHPDSNRLLLQTSLGWYLLITIHIITFIYAAFFSGLLLLLLTSTHKNRFRNLMSTGIAWAFGCLLAAWFIMPIATMQKYFFLGVTWHDPSQLSVYHPFLSQLLFSGATLTKGYHASALLTMHPSVGWPILMGAGLCLYACLNRQLSGGAEGDNWFPLLLVLFGLAFLMAWSPFNLWQYLPQPLLVAQYSWRLLGQVIWMGALLFAAALCWLFKNQLDLRHIVIGTLLIAFGVNAWFPVSENAVVTTANFVARPLAIYNNNSYVLDFTKYTSLVDSIDSVLIAPDPVLKSGFSYKLPLSLLNIAVSPAISLSGSGSAKIKNLQLSAVLDGKIISRKQLGKGAFHWHFKLTPLKKNISDHRLMFSASRSSHADIPMNGILLTGFIKKSELMSLDQVKPACQQRKAETVCKLDVPATVRLVELPVLFYPKMLAVTINGKKSAYQSVMYQGKLITGIQPESGKLNTITVRFRGLVVGNIASRIAFGLWFLILLSLIFPRMFPYRRPSH